MQHRIDVIVAKNSGGTATYGKIAAANEIGLPVIMLRRPPLRAEAAKNVEQVLAWLDHLLASALARGV